MSANEFLVDAVAQFLQGSDWQDSITQLLENNYTLFVPETTETAEDKQNKGVGYTFEQYAVFQQFTNMAERLLEGVIGELGCNAEDLFQILQQNLKSSSTTGERRFFIKTLLAFEDYDAFHTRITQYAVAKQATVVATDENAELSEWHLQLALAQAVLDAYARGQLDETEQSYVPWADALMQMAYGTTSDPSKYTSDDAYTGGEGAEWTKDRVDVQTIEHNLIMERLKVDLLVAQRIADANSQLKTQMLHLSTSEYDEREAESSSNAEADLEALFTQVDTIRERLKGVKSQCFAFKSVTPEAMDTMYLYLKEKIHLHQDLVSQETAIFEFIFTHLDQSDAGLIPLLLEWLLLESEGLSVQNQIQEALGQGPPAVETDTSEKEGYWTQTWDESSQAYFYYHSVSGESVWEPPACGYYDVNQDFQYPESITVAETATEGSSVEGSTSAEAKAESSVDAFPDLKQTASEMEAHMASTAVGQNLEQLLEMEQTLKKIAEEYEENRKRLELVLQVEKARQKEELRKHREKKRRAKKEKKKKQLELEDGGEEDASESKDGDDETKQSPVVVPPPPAAPITQRPNAIVLRAEAKESSDTSAGLSMAVPGRGRINLSHLLSDTHAKRNLPPPPNTQMMLNPTSLKYLSEQLARKNRGDWSAETVEVYAPPKSARVVVELELEEEGEEK